MANRHKALGRNRGAWAGNTFYLRSDVVYQAGSLWSSKTDFTSGSTFDSSNWDLLLAAALRDVGAGLITQGPGLPAFAGRQANDTHYDTTTGKTNILTGISGGSVTEPFTYPDGSLWGKVSPGGQTWVDPGVYGAGGGGHTSPPISGNRIVGPTSSYCGARLTVGSFGRGGSVSVRTRSQTDGGQVWVELGGNPTNYAGLNVQIQTQLVFGQGYGSLDLVWRDPTTGASTNLASIGNGQVTAGAALRSDSDTIITLNLAPDGTVTVQYGGLTKVSAVLTTAQMAALGSMVGFHGNTTYFDDFAASANGTLNWQFQDPIYLQAQLVSGNVATGTHVLKPGVRVPTDTILREVVLRADTAPTGAAITVQVERFNGGVSQGIIATASILAGAAVGSVTGLSAACAKGDMLKFNITSVGSTVAGADLTASLEFH